MTEIITVLNRQSVAIAANRVTYENALIKSVTMTDNIFQLSDTVAVATYHDCMFMGMPMEAVLNEFRLSLGEQRLDTVKDYVDSFNDFLTMHRFFNDFELEDYLFRLFGSYLEKIVRHVKVSIGIKDDSVLGKSVKEELESLISKYDKKEKYEVFKDFGYDEFGELYADIWKSYIPEGRNKVLYIFDEQDWDVLVRAFYGYLTTTIESEIYTGVVFIGYGDSDMLPCVLPETVTISLDGHLLLLNSVRHGCFGGFYDHNLETPSEINLFGTSEWMKKVIKGINVEIMNRLLDNAGTLSKAGTAKLAEAIATLSILGLGNNPLADASFNKIDVAVISKADGFKWIRHNQKNEQ